MGPGLLERSGLGDSKQQDALEMAKPAHVRGQGDKSSAPGQALGTGDSGHLLETAGGQQSLPEREPGELGLQGLQPGPVTVPEGEVERTFQQERPVAQFLAEPQRIPQDLEDLVGMNARCPSLLGLEQPGPFDPASPGLDPDPGPQAHGSRHEGQG